MANMLEINGLCKHYPGFSLEDISFSIPGGTIMGLIGENGAGKSTCIKAMLELISKDGGQVLFWGQELNGSPELKEDIGVVFDDINFYETLTPKKMGRISAAAYKKWDMELYNDYLQNFSLPTDKELKSFSKGMRMKLSIALALSHRPKLLILDEATGGLDPVMRDDILDILLDFVQDEEHSILISSHISSDLEKAADYITFIHSGRLLLTRSKDELLYSYGIIRCGAEDFNGIDRSDILAYRRDDYQYSVLVENREQAAHKYRGLVIDSPSIDEIMLLYVKGEMLR